jgi:hypothetical protein
VYFGLAGRGRAGGVDHDLLYRQRFQVQAQRAGAGAVGVV